MQNKIDFAYTQTSKLSSIEITNNAFQILKITSPTTSAASKQRKQKRKLRNRFL
jgi:hypothetical protein